MQQPPYGQPGRPPALGHAAPNPGPRKVSPALIASLVGGGIVVVAGLGFLLQGAAQRQKVACDAAITTARTKVASSDAVGARGAVQEARDACKSLRATEVAALDAAVENLEKDAKAQQARPALLAAGFKPEQLARATMAPVCKARERMPVEMVASQIAGEPRYWDCDKDVLWQDAPQTPASCDARGLEFTTTHDENGKAVGACKKGSAKLEEERLRKACKVSATAKIYPADRAEVIAVCRIAVEKVLKSPKSAEFPGVLDEDGKPESADGCTTRYVSYVDAQNGFGAKVRTRFTCTYDARTGVATPLVL